jgi:hypothetical protein
MLGELMEKFGEIAVREGYINEVQLAETLERQKEHPKRLGRLLTEAGYLTDSQLAGVLSLQLKLPLYRPAEMNLDAELLELITPRQAERLHLIPVELTEGKLTVATAEPLNLEGLDQLRKSCPYKLKIAVAAESQIAGALQKFYATALESVATVLEDLTEADLRQYRNHTLSEVNQISPESMEAQKVFPVLAVEMIGVGEESGNLSGMLSQVAKTYETEVKNAIGIFLAVFEPVLILLMVGVIGILAVSILLPIINLNSKMG